MFPLFFRLQFRNFKIVYRRYAGLYFCICVDVSDNNLAYLEAIHNFVEVLNEYFHNVCELDLVFNFYKVSIHKFYIIDNWEQFVSMEMKSLHLNFQVGIFCPSPQFHESKVSSKMEFQFQTHTQLQS